MKDGWRSSKAAGYRVLLSVLALVGSWMLTGGYLEAALEAAGLGAQRQPVRLLGETLLLLTVEGAVQRLPLFSTQGLTLVHPEVDRVIIVVHGTLRNADGYFASMRRAAELAGAAAQQTLIIAPQFLADVDAHEHPIPPDVPVWTVDGWKDGSPSEARPGRTADDRVSSFAVLDALLLALADRHRFPHLGLIVLAGHSAGGQYVQRYAALGKAPTMLVSQGVRTRFIVANPSSYLYFDERRPTNGGFALFSHAACPEFDRYKYGLAQPVPYAARQNAAAILQQYAARDVVYLLGTADDNPHHATLDRSCAAEAQGPSRLARGQNYYRYLQVLLGPDVTQRHHLVLVRDVGHDHSGMWRSACGLSWLFADGGC